MSDLFQDLIPLMVVSILAWLTQLVLAVFVEAEVWRKLTNERTIKKVWWRQNERTIKKVWWPQNGLCPRRHPLEVTVSASADVLSIHDVKHWDADSTYWSGRAASIRRSFLQRTQETAEKWRNIFAGLLGVFSVVFFVDKPGLADTSDPSFVRCTIVTVIALALHAVAYTGWAAAGLPKMLMDVDSVTVFQEEMRQGARALTRLRVGLTAGVLTAVGLTVIVAGVLTQSMPD